MGAPPGNKNAAGPHGGGGDHPHDRAGSSHKEASATDEKKLAPSRAVARKEVRDMSHAEVSSELNKTKIGLGAVTRERRAQLEAAFKKGS